MGKRNTIHDAQTLASKKEGRCLSPVYENNWAPMLWECAALHTWTNCYSNIQQGQWCKTCLGRNTTTIQDVQELASALGWKCLSQSITNAHSKMRWECGFGHIWESEFNSVKRGARCPGCSKKMRHTIFDAQSLASIKQGRCLSIVYRNSGSHLIWECDKLHVWKAAYDTIKAGGWCPRCVYHESKPQVCIYEFVKQFHSDTEISRRSLLKSTGLELDIYIPGLKKAIEYNGRYWHSTNEAKERDSRKKKECKQAGIKLLVVTDEMSLEVIEKKVLKFIGKS